MHCTTSRVLQIDGSQRKCTVLPTELSPFNHLFFIMVANVFLVFDFCWFCMVIRFFHSRHNGQWPPTSKDFYTRYYPLHYFLILILEKEPVFPFSMLSAIFNKGTTGTIFITSLVWRGPWLGIEPRTSTTRLSRRRCRKQKHNPILHFTWVISL